MKRILCSLALLIAVGSATPLLAQETVEAELELVKQLRARGWNDLAKAKIEALLKRNDPTLNAVLPLELARINISSARLQDPDQRLATFNTARAQLQDFIAKNKGKADAAIAAVEVARLTQYHAQAILSKAMREEENKERHEKARPAETKFIEAGKELEDAIKLLEAAIQDTGNANSKTKLQNELRQAKFDLAVNLFDQAKTYINRGNLTVAGKRGEIISKAIKAFVALRSDESSEVGWLANAWLMKCSMEIDAPGDVQKYFKSVMERSGDKAIQKTIEPAVRLVRYFHMQDQTLPRPDEPETLGSNHISGNPKKPQPPMERIRAVEKEGEAWLKAYPSHLKSYEGQGVRYELAHAYLADAYDLEKEKKDRKQVDAAFKNAALHFKILGDYDGELAGRSRDVALWLDSKLVAEGKTQLKTFDQFFTKGMIERKNVIAASRMLEEGKDRKSAEEKRNKHLKDTINAFAKALTLVEDKTPIAKIDDARYYLCGAYIALGDSYRGAITAEALGKSRLNRRGAEGASTAISTYSSLQARFPEDVGIKRRLNDMAEFVLSPAMQKSWANDPVTSLAHYHMGMAAKRENNAKKAIDHLAKIQPDFTDYVYTQGQLVFIAEAARTMTEDKTEQKWYSSAARAAIKRMPKMEPKNEIPSVIAMYFFAKVEDSKYQYMEAFEDLNAREELKAIKKFNDMGVYIKTLRSELDKVPPYVKGENVPNGQISKQNHEQIEFTMAIMSKYADLGIAEARFRSDAKDRFDQVLAATKSVVDGTLAKAKAAPAGSKINMRDYKVTSDILSLALRASVQKGDTARGKEILDVLQRLADEKGEQRPFVAVLLNDIAGQIKSLKERNDSSLKDTKANYTAFLDVIGKELESKGFDNNAAILLAHAYMSLDYPAKAAGYFAKYKAPAILDKKVPKGYKYSEEEENDLSRYWGVQIEQIRALRATKDKDSYKQAEDQAKKIIFNENAKFKIQAMMEKNYLIEDQQRYREAYGEWAKFLKMPSLTNNLSKPEVQKIYFPGYYHATRTLFLVAILDKDIKDRQKLITGAAQQIIKVENSKSREGWNLIGPMFMELFKDKEYEKLKKEYERLKDANKGSSLWPDRGALTRDVFCSVVDCETHFVAADTPDDKLKALIEKSEAMEKEKRFRQSYAEWVKFLKDPVLINGLAKANIQKVYFTGYFNSVRALSLTASHDPDIKDRPKLITAAASNIIKIEYSKSKEGWAIAGPMFMGMLADPQFKELKSEYDRQKTLRDPSLEPVLPKNKECEKLKKLEGNRQTPSFRQDNTIALIAPSLARPANTF